MGYHIFMARKVQLTTLKNDAYAGMMGAWIAQEHVADQKMDTMETKNENMAQEYKSYSALKDSIYDKYDTSKEGNVMDGGNLDSTDANGEKFRDLRDRELQQAKDDYEAKVEEYKGKYEEDIQQLSDDESAIEKEIQILETHISEYTEEMSKVEQQEATEIKVCIPNYNGAGGGQG
ncbi:hypothetical protein IKQ26_04265 [bacterium]|nr:hypothetical protein [bacterium]